MGQPTQQTRFACDGGILTVATPRAEMRLRWGPRPLAEQRLAGGHWHAFIPTFRLLAPADDMRGASDPAVARKHAALLAFRESIPEELAAPVEPFRSHQWPLLCLLQASKPARDLVAGNPVLAFAVAANHEVRRTPSAVAADHAVRHCHQRQREIARWLGYPESEAMVRLFRKVPLDLAGPTLLRRLCGAAASPEGLRMLGHLPELNMGVLHLLGQKALASLVTWQLVRDVAASPDERETALTGDVLVDAMGMLGEMLAIGSPSPFNSVRQVAAFREAVLREYQRRADHTPAERLRVRGHNVGWVQLPRPAPIQPARPAPRAPRARGAPRPAVPPRISAARSSGPLPSAFPAPPFPDTEHIRALRSTAELANEGIAQHNCVGRPGLYAPHVRAGQCYIYKVLAPERATLSLVRRTSDAWTIGELKAAYNTVAKGETWRAVRQWLDGHQVSL